MLSMVAIDALDARIILALDDDPDATILALSRTLGIARNTVHARLRRLTGNGALKPFSQRFDLRALGYELVAFMSLSVSQTDPGIVAGLLGVPEVISAHYTTGDADILVHVVAKDTRDLHRITNAILAIDGVARTSTAVSLHEAIPYRPHALLRSAAGPAARAEKARQPDFPPATSRALG
jgi:DNA-binding Lrp family transcriptional regulator